MRKLTKKVLLVGLLVTLSSTAFADPRGYYGRPDHYNSYYQPHHFSGARTTVYNNYRGGSKVVDVLVPLAIGGVIGYALNNNNAQQSEPVIVQQPAPQIVQQIIEPNISSSSTYHYENVYLDSCGCTRRVLVRE